jgi:hypothetical protein
MSERICFVIAPIGEPESETRKRSDQVLKHVIVPAALGCKYKAVRADQISEPGMITSQVIQHVVDDPLVIADLTERNPNVFYELAIRHAIRKPLVQLIKKGEQIPFDVAGTRTIQVDHRDLDSVEEAKKEITSQIQALEKDSSKLETPISVSLDLQMLRQSDNPEQRSLADVLSVITALRSSVDGIEKRLERPESWLPMPMFEELIERRDLRSHRSRAILSDLRHMLRDLMALADDKANAPKSREAQREMLIRIEKMIMMLAEREF